MKKAGLSASSRAPALPNGSGAAAILSAGAGCFAVSVLAFAGDKSTAIRNGLNFYKPTGPLSGVTTLGILLWLVVWALLAWRWGNKTVAIGRVAIVALVLLGLSFVLTYPPVVDLF